MRLEDFLALIDETIRLNLIISLYVDGKLSEGKACELVGADRLEFRTLTQAYLNQAEASAIPAKLHIEPGEEERFLGDFQKAAKAHPGLTLYMDFVNAWYLLEAIQLSYAHPNLPESIKASLKNLGGLFEDELAVLPGLKEVARRGWSR